MKEDCILCQIIEGKIPSEKVYEDEYILAVLDINGANPGHTFVIPKEHYTILEQVPDFLVGKLFSIANRVSSCLFESLSMHGTNLLVANGIPAGQIAAHFMINVVPRNENDGINITWQPRKVSEEEMSTVEIQLKEAAKNIGGFETKGDAEQVKAEEPQSIAGEDSYLLRQISRIP